MLNNGTYIYNINTYPCKLFKISFDAYSKNKEELPRRIAFLLALLKDAAVPSGDLASIPPSKIKMKRCYVLKIECFAGHSLFTYVKAKIYIQIDFYRASVLSLFQ